MRVPMTWLREYAPVPASEAVVISLTRLINAGLEVETGRCDGRGHLRARRCWSSP